jgi:hypothetical protein
LKDECVAFQHYTGGSIAENRCVTYRRYGQSQYRGDASFKIPNMFCYIKQTVDGGRPTIGPVITGAFATEHLNAINAQRLLRSDTRPLVADSVGDNEIQKAITVIKATGQHDDGIEAFTTAMNAAKSQLSAYRSCDLVVMDMPAGQSGQTPSNIVSNYLTNNRLEQNRERFTYMLKKGQQKVSVGYLEMRNGNQCVVYWLCPGQGTRDNTVGQACMKRSGSGMYNSCFNEVQLTTTNLIRGDHQSDTVALNTQLASTLQRQLNDLRSSNLNDVEECWAACVGPVESQDRTLCGSGRRCDSTVRKLYADATNAGGCRSDSIAITVYKETDSSKLWDFWSSGRASQRAYDSAIFNYEFSRNRPRNRDASSTHGFTNIVWASTTQVGFAMRGNLGVLAYCTPAANDQTCTDCSRSSDIGTQCGSNSCRAGGSCTSTLSGFCANVKSNRYDSCETK